MALGPDIDPSNTYAGVGRSISSWELVEVELAVLYSIFIGKPNDLDAIVEYGKLHSIFNNRMNAVGKAAASFFLKQPSQEKEGEWSSIDAVARELADKRHQIAHGIVMISSLPSEDAMKVHLNEFAVKPPWYSIFNLTKKSGRHPDVGIWGGGYDYKVADLNDIASTFDTLRERIQRFRQSILT
jgi:hypothetical protein